MKRLLLSILFVVPWLISSAQDTTLQIGFESQEAFDSNWSQIGGEASWTWLNHQAGANSFIPVAQWQVVSPIPEKGTIIAYKQGLNMKAGTGEAGLYSRSNSYSAKAFEILVATDDQFNNIVATVQSSSKGTNFGMRPIGNQYQPNTFTIDADGTYYVGFRCISQYGGEATTEGTLMVNYLQVSFDKYEPPTPSACTNVAAISKSTETTLAADLSWTWPTTDTNGNALADVGAYIYRSTTETDLIITQNLVSTVECALQTGNGLYADENISEPGTYYYAIVPFTSNSISSVAPQIVSVKIDYIDPFAPISLELPYLNELGSEDDLDGFSIDPTGWQINANGYLYLNGPAAGTSVSSLKSPAFEMMDGVQYAVSFDAWVSSGTNHFIALKAGGSAEQMENVGEPANITASQAQPQRVQFVVTGNAQAKMYLAFEGTVGARASMYMDNITVEEYVEPEVTISLPYLNELGSEDDLDGFSIDPTGWQINANGYLYLNGPAAGTSVSSLKSPAFEMMDGVQYAVSFDAWVSSGTNHFIALKAGGSAEQMENVGEPANITASQAQPQRVQFVVTGNAQAKTYLAFEGTAMARASLYMDNITVEEYVPQPVISIDGINLDVTLQPTYVALSIAASDITKENLGDASIALYYKLSMSNDAVSEDESAYIAMNEDDANYTAEIPYGSFKPGASYMISIKATATEADNIIAQDINDEAGEFTYSPTISINDLNVIDVTTESVDLNIQYVTEYLPEDATITASISEDSWTEPQLFAISGNPATLSVTGLESGKEYTFLVTLQAGESDAIIYSDTKEIKIQTPGIFVDKINLDVILQPTCVALSIATSDITKENLGDASIALYYKLTMSNDVVSEDESAYIAMNEDDANYTAEIPYGSFKPGASYMISIKATATEADNIIAQDINDEAGEFTYSPTISINDLNVIDVTTESVDLNIQYVTEYLPEDATITASISEDSWTEPQLFAISGNPATLSVTGLESGKEYTLHVTLQAGEGDAIIYSNTADIEILTTGISDIATDIANGARYYNLQGVEVSNPETGIYIRIMNGETKKVLIKETK